MTRRVGVEGSKKKRRGERNIMRPSPSAQSTAIPIPSFSSCDDSSPAESPSGEHYSSPSPWNKLCLLRTEGALEVYFLSQRSRRKRSLGGSNLLPLNDFYSMARRLALAKVADVQDGKEQNVSKSSVLSEEERLLHDLLCVASPSLYKLVQASPENSTTGRQMWCLEVIPFDGNRMEELKRLVNQNRWNDTKRKSILDAIQSHKSSLRQNQRQKVQSKTKTASDKEKMLLEPEVIRPDMNLEERVIARAEARQKRQLASKQASDSADTTSIDRASLVKLADAIWSHSRHIMLRQSQMELSSPRNRSKNDRPVEKKKERSCVMTLKDVVQTFSGSLAIVGGPSSGKAASLHPPSKEKASQRQVVQALQELERLVPGWITVVDPQGESEKKGRVSKNATVWIKPIEYQSARLRLAGQSKLEEDRVCKPPIGKRASPETTERELPPVPDVPQVLDSHMNRVPRVSLTPAKTEQGKSREAPQASESSPPASKKARTLASPLKLAPALYTPTKSMPIAGTKRPAQGPPSASQGTPKKRRGLRVNKNLILTDADYIGGEVIEPTGASPRGLKMLFSKLKEGKRI